MNFEGPVLHIVPALFGDSGVVGGAERYALELARNMAKQTPTTLMSFGAKDEDYRMDELRIRILGSPHYVKGQKMNPIAAGMVGEILKAQVVHCHQQHVLASSLSALLCRLSGRKVFVSNLGGGGWDISHYIPNENWYHGHLHISQYSRMLFGHEGKPWAKVIYGGVDTEKFKPIPGLETRGPVVFTGRLMPHKGVDVLIQAAGEPISVEVIGRPYDADYQKELVKLAEGKPVLFRTDCSDQDLVEAYQRALCVVLPSVYKDFYGNETKIPELLGQTLLEGMACGTPVICSNVASMPEVVEDGVTGFVVPPNDPIALRAKLEWLLANPEAVKRMGEAGRQRVMRLFSWDQVVRNCIGIYTGAQ